MNFRIVIFILIFSSFNSCVVTDEIDFEDKINNPPLLISVNPPNSSINNSQAGEVLEFSVTLWDPDEDDAALYDGRISLIEQLNSTTSDIKTYSCKGPDAWKSDEFDGGIIVSLKCELSLNAINNTDNSLLIKIETSDRGYLTGDRPESGATTLEVIWGYELVVENDS